MWMAVSFQSLCRVGHSDLLHAGYKIFKWPPPTFNWPRGLPGLTFNLSPSLDLLSASENIRLSRISDYEWIYVTRIKRSAIRRYELGLLNNRPSNIVESEIFHSFMFIESEYLQWL